MVFVVKISKFLFVCEDHHHNHKILIIISENPEHTLLKQCIKNSLSLNKGNQDHNDVWISDVN